MHFWLNRGGQNWGPYTLPQLINMATAGTIKSNEMVRHQYGSAWIPIGQLLDNNPSGWRHYHQPSGLSVYRPGNTAVLFDARPAPNHTYDVVVIGSGMGGGTLAHQLAGYGLDVLVLEVGEALFSSHIANQPRRHVAGAFTNFWEVYDHCFKSTNTVELVSGESGGYVGGQAICLGGRSVVWGGVALRMREWEFAGWPTGLSNELYNIWYPKAENLMAVAPPPSNGYSERLCRILSDLFSGGMIATPTPMAVRFSRPPAVDTGYFSTADLLTEQHLAEGYPGRKPTVVLQHQVRQLQLNDKSVVACYVDDLSTGMRTMVRGRVFVVAAGAVESARLFQVSGIGQPFAGRGITDHAISYCRFSIPSTSSHYSTNAARITLQPNVWQGHQYNVLVTVNSGLFLSRYAGGAIEQLDMATRQRSIIGEVVFLHHSPLLESNVVGPTDPNWQGPMRLCMHPQLLSDALCRECDEVAAQVIRGLGGVPLDNQQVRCMRAPLGNVAHEVGTLRMANYSGQGVVDPNLQVYGLTNLFACDLSVFPSSPAANPSLTLVALASRLANTLANRFSRT